LGVLVNLQELLMIVMPILAFAYAAVVVAALYLAVMFAPQLPESVTACFHAPAAGFAAHDEGLARVTNRHVDEGKIDLAHRASKRVIPPGHSVNRHSGAVLDVSNDGCFALVSGITDCDFGDRAIELLPPPPGESHSATHHDCSAT
jgi:hypothetical protein